MGVYIPNVRKPKKCGQCPCAYFTEGALSNVCQITGDDIDDIGELLKNCPMQEIDDIQHEAYIDGIEPSETPKEIVRCKECKRSLTYTMNSNLPISRWCLRFSAPVAVEDDDYCSYGERRMIWE